jgi:hypothetical protein
MSELTEVLNQIIDFIGSENNQILKLFNLGISIPEIEKIVEVLPFRITTEIAELYMWRGGALDSTDVIGGRSFMPLSVAVSIYEDMLPLDITDQSNNDSYFWQVGWFPIFYIDSVYYFVSCRDDESLGKVYEYVLESCKPDLIFSNLTSMMKGILKCYQEEVYKIEPQHTVLLPIDDYETYRIFAKIDPDIEYWKHLPNR